MDVVVGIFSQLGANGTVLHQFVILVALFFVSKALFLNKLQFVLDVRDEQTNKQELEADKNFERAEELSKRYSDSLNATYEDAQKIVEEKRSEVEKREREQLKLTEKEMAEFVTKARSENENFIHEKKGQIFKDVDTLSKKLVDRFIS